MANDSDKLNELERADLIAAALLALAMFLTALPSAFFAPDTHHDGMMLMPALDLASGLAPFRESFSKFGALTVLLQAAAIKAWPDPLAAIRLQTALFYAAACAVFFLSFRRLLPRAAAIAAGIAFLSLPPYLAGGRLQPWSSAYALFFQGAALYCLIGYCWRGGRRLFLAGAFCSMAMWCRQPVGFLLLLAAASGVLAAHLRPFRPRAAGRGLAALGAGFALFCAVMAAWLHSQGAIGDAWRQSVLYPYHWAREIVAEPAFPGLFATLFPRGEVLARHHPYLWNLLPASCLGLAAAVLARPAFFGGPRRASALFCAAAVGIFSWAQYYPYPELLHTYWGGAPMIGVFCCLLWEAGSRLRAPRRAAFFAILFLAAFFPPALQRLSLGYAALKTPSAKIQGIPALEGMSSAPREAAYLRAIAGAVSDHTAAWPDLPVTNVGGEILFSAFAARRSGPRPFTAFWPGMEQVYPETPALLQNFIAARTPAVISDRFPAKRDGYTLRAFASQKGPGLALRVYVAGPAGPGEDLYITDLVPDEYAALASGDGTVPFTLEAAFSRRAPGSYSGLQLAAYDADGAITACWQAGDVEGDLGRSLGRACRAGTPDGPLRPARDGRIRFRFTCAGEECLRAASLVLSVKPADKKRLARRIHFHAPAHLFAPPGAPGTVAGPAGPPGPLPAAPHRPEPAPATVPGNPGTCKGMARLPAGNFMMGTGEGAPGDGPKHAVFLEPFFIDRCEVTAGDYAAYAASLGRRAPQQPRWSGPASPVVAVDWYEAEAYCRAQGKRLPTEAEWERAALAGGDACPAGKVDEYAWHRGNSPNGAQPGAALKPNALGLYDMQGNAAEWVSDWYAADAYSSGPRKSPRGPETGAEKVQRGGSWGDFACHYAANVRVTRRGRDYPVRRSAQTGFRCARDAEPSARP